MLLDGMDGNCEATHIEETADTNDRPTFLCPLIEYPVLLGLVELFEIAKEPAGARRTREHPQRRVPTPGAEDAMTEFPRTCSADREKNCEEGCEESLKGRKHGARESQSVLRERNTEGAYKPMVVGGEEEGDLARVAEPAARRCDEVREPSAPWRASTRCRRQRTGCSTPTMALRLVRPRPVHRVFPAWLIGGMTASKRS